MARYKELNFEQLVELKSLLSDYKRSGRTMTELSADYPVYTLKAVDYWHKKFEKNPNAHVDREVERATLARKAERIKKLLEKYPGKTFLELAAENPEYTSTEIRYYNDKVFKIRPIEKRIRRTDESKLEVLEYAKLHGVMAAARRYHIGVNCICRWNKKFKIYDQREKVEAVPKEKIIEMLCEVAAFNKSTNTFSGATVIAEKHGYAMQTFYHWNSIYHIFEMNEEGPRKSGPDTTIDQQKQIIESWLDLEKLNKVSRKTGHATVTIKKFLTPEIIKQISTENGHDR